MYVIMFTLIFLLSLGKTCYGDYKTMYVQMLENNCLYYSNWTGCISIWLNEHFVWYMHVWLGMHVHSPQCETHIP